MTSRLQTGFTLIEMVILIVVLGIIAAAGIPRFVNMNTEAIRATVAGTSSSFQDAVIMVRAAATAKGVPFPSLNVPGFGDGTVDIDAAGFPVDGGTLGGSTSNNITAGRCRNVWNNILQNPPTITTSGLPFSSTRPEEYRAQRAGPVANRFCRYTYRKVASPIRRIEYYVNTGRVITTNP